jgi:integrase
MPTLPLEAFRERLLSLYAPPMRSARTLKKMARVLSLVAGVGAASTEDLTTERAAEFVRLRTLAGASPNTIRGELGYLSAACTYAVEEGYLERCPRFKRVRPRPAPPSRPRVHAIEDVGRVLERLRSRAVTWEGRRLYALASVAAYTGLRRDELLWLECSDVRLEERLIEVVARRRLKTEGSAAPVPIPPPLSAVLAGWLPEAGPRWLFPALKRSAPWTGGTSGRRPCDRLRHAGEECGVEGLTFQSLRHTFATWCRRRWGLSSLELADCLRHTSPRTQAHYVGSDRAGLVAAVANIAYPAA